MSLVSALDNKVGFISRAGRQISYQGFLTALEAAVCLACAWLPPLEAHENPPPSLPSFPAIRVEEPVIVDGVLDEPCWQQAVVTTDFIDIRTQQPADQQTLVRVAYSRTHIYFAVECLDDNMAEVHASELREDRDFQGDDWVEVHLDPLHNHRTKYAFFSNPLGTCSDANEGPSGQFNRGWTVDWELKARMLEDRWVFEMGIPLSVLNYERQDGQTWALNFTRMLRRTDVQSFWSYNPTDYFKPRHFGHLTGLDLADSQFDRNWEVSPYVSAQVDFNGDTHSRFQTGLDLSFRLTPTINTAWTLNPDFGQVESDADTIELRDTERFLPEKRLFFREGNELMRMPHDLYYSRRFSDITGGAKISGKNRRFNYSFLDIYGDTHQENTREGNSAVLRVLQNVGQKSSLGYYVADSEMRDGHSRVVSSDGYFFLSEDWRISCQAAGADDRYVNPVGEIGKDSLDYLGYAALIYDSYPWEFNWGVRGISDEFNPTLGYIPRRDIYGPSFLGMYRHESDERWYKDIRLGYNFQYYLDNGWDTSLHDHSVFSHLTLPNDLALSLNQDLDYHRPYHNRRTQAGVTLFSSDFWKAIDFKYANGEFEEIDYHEFNFSKGIKFIERWPITYQFVIRMEEHPDGEEAYPWLNRIVFDYYFTDKMWLKTSVQNQDASVHNISVIYGWEFVHNAHWYLVYNDVDQGHDPDNPMGEGRSVFSKIVYTF